MPGRARSRRAPAATIHEGDCLDVLQGFESGSVDSIVTDPPAGIGFMGKEWDTPGALVERRSRKGETWDAVGGNHHPADNKDKYRTLRVEGAKFRAFLTPIFEECLRVLKPGGHAVVWALPRTSHWTGTSIEDAGFEVRDVVTHHFGQGFPKSHDVSKAIDKSRGGRHFNEIRAHLREAIKKSGLTHTEVENRLGYADGSGIIGHWTGRSQPSIPTSSAWEQMRAFLPLDPKYDELMRALDREVIGHKDSGLDRAGGTSVSFSAEGRDETGLLPITAPASIAAQEWSRWGTALKPATEFWFLARKPLNGTVAANVLQHGTGALNIDGCRVGGEARSFVSKGIRPGQANYVGDSWQGAGEEKCVEGRWPANLILSHAPDCSEAACAPSCAVAEMDRQSGQRAPGHFPKNTGQSPMWGGAGGGLNGRDQIERYTEPGGASRFFYVPKPTRRERDAGLDDLPTQTADAYAEHRGRRMSEPSRIDGKPPAQGRNTHPTVKPIELMRYLLRLVTPPGGVALDPFAGSGTTGCAAVIEGFRFIGIERERAYVRITRRRIAAAGRER